MLNTDQTLSSAQRLRALQLIIVAFAMGASIFIAVVTFLPIGQSNSRDGEDESTVLTLVAVAWGVMSVPLAVLLSVVVVKSGRDKIAKTSAQPAGSETRMSGSSEPDTAAQLYALFAAKTILTAAMFEGAALLAGVAYMLEHQVLALGVAVVTSMCIIIQLPTQDRFGHWIENQTRRVEEARQLHGNPLSS